MLKHLKTLSKDSLVYGLGNASASLVSFLMLPIYARYLTPADYGYLTLYTVFQSIAEITISFSLSSALFRYYLMSQGDKQVLATVMAIQAALIAGIGVPLLLASRPLAHALYPSAPDPGNIARIILTAMLTSAATLVFSLLRAKRKTYLFATLQLTRAAGLAALNILLVVVLKRNFNGIILANLLLAASMAAILLPPFARDFKAPFSRGLARRILSFCAPIYLVNLFAFFLNMSDRFFLDRFLTPRDVGIYAFGTKLGALVNMGLITPFSTAVLPYALSIAKQPHFASAFARIVKYFAFAAVACSLPVFFFSEELIRLLGKEAYAEAALVVGPNLLSGVFFGLYYALSIQLDIAEKTYLATLVVFAGGAVSVLSNWFLIPRLGILGAAWSGAISNFVLCACMYAYGQRALPIRHDIGAFARLAGLVAVYGFAFWITERLAGREWVRVTARAAVLVGFPALAFASGWLDADEKRWLAARLGWRA